MTEMKFRLELNDKPNSQSLHEVFIRINDRGSRQKVKTNVYCRKEHFGVYKDVLVKDAKTKIEKVVNKRILTHGKWISNKDREAAYKNNQLEKKLNEYKKTYDKKKEIAQFVTKEAVVEEIKRPFELRNVIDYMTKKIEKYEKNDDYENKKGYITAKNHLANYLDTRRRKNIDFREIDNDFLESYESYLRNLTIGAEKKKRSVGSVHTIIKRLRTVFNDAIKDKTLTPDIYPFAIYQLPTPPKVYKERLNEEEFIQWENQKYERDSFKFVCQQAFLFAVYMAGMRIEDLLSLKVKNIIHGRITYNMRKGNTNNKLKSIKITPKIQEILNYFVTKQSKPEDYVFPILPANAATLTNTEYKKMIGAKTALINKFLKQIAEDACIDKNVKTHIARHSFSSKALKKTKDIKALQEALGHSDPKITAGYLEELNIENLDEMMDSVFE